MQMYLFGRGRYGRYDGAMDASMVYHEYAHGLSERLVTDAQGFGALIGAQPGAIAEGTSDFYAMDYLAQTEPGLVPDGGAQGEVRVGKWLQADIGHDRAERDPHRGPRLRGAAAGRRERVSRRLGADDAGRLPLQRLRPDRQRPRAARRRRDLGADAVVDPLRARRRARPAGGPRAGRARTSPAGSASPPRTRRSSTCATRSSRRPGPSTAATTGRRSGTCSPRAAWAGGPRPRARTTRRPSRTSTRPRTRRAARRAAAR